MAKYPGHAKAAQASRGPFENHPSAASAYEGEQSILTSPHSPLIFEWSLLMQFILMVFCKIKDMVEGYLSIHPGSLWLLRIYGINVNGALAKAVI